MIYTLNNEISFCRIEGGLIFLDIDTDRYFRLSRKLESAFVDYLESDGHTRADVSGLVERNILTPGTASIGQLPTAEIPALIRSAFESFPAENRLRILEITEVFAFVCSTRMQLRFRPLKHVLRSLAFYREREASHPPDSPSESLIQRLLDATFVFRCARPYVPLETCCLLDSLAMAKFLARRGLHANVVFGVIGDPFSAHCWLQAGTLVLNDSIGNIDTYTPIRVI